jgi:uncharacterized protein YprB with RNaseH-like and TPR domain
MSNQSLDPKLDRFRNLIAVSEGKAMPTKRTGPARYQRLADALSAKLIARDSGSYCLKTTLLPFSYIHGSLTLHEATSAVQWPISAFTSLESPGRVAPHELIYLDTETTGLGGAGMVPFLIGIGKLVEEGLEVRQFVIPDYDDESAMLADLLEEIAEAKVVTYNGASFDLPVLRDRYIINRVHRNLPFEGNIDLLQATRRLFKRRLKDCSLVNVERELFGFRRTDDIPGYLVPSVYFDWLSTENVSQLPSVLDHNLYDIVSLHFLAAHVAHTFHTEGETLQSVEDVYSLSRIYHRRNDRERTTRLCARLDSENPGSLAPDIRLFQAFALKKSSRWEQAIPVFEEIAGQESREGYWANLELSKYFEHRGKDFERALRHARRAGSHCPCTKAEKEKLFHRITRLKSLISG